MTRLLAAHPDVIASGTVSNQGQFYDVFEQVVLLKAPLGVLLDRVRRRANNPYGKTSAQRAEIRRYLKEVEPLLRRSSSLELGGQLPVSRLADTLEALVSATSYGAIRSDGTCVTPPRLTQRAEGHPQRIAGSPAPPAGGPVASGAWAIRSRQSLMQRSE